MGERPGHRSAAEALTASLLRNKRSTLCRWPLVLL